MAVDLDGTLTESSHNGDKFCLSYIANPRPHAREVLQRMKRRGFRIVIFTGRLDPETWGRRQVREQRKMIEGWLRAFKIPYDHLTGYKPGKAFILIDDRAVKFHGNWILAEADIHVAKGRFDAMRGDSE